VLCSRGPITIQLLLFLYSIIVTLFFSAVFTWTNYNPITIIPLLNYSNAIFSAVFTWTNYNPITIIPLLNYSNAIFSAVFTWTNYNPITIIPLLNYSCAIFSAVFTWTNLLVVVVELDGNENEALDLVPLVTNCVLEEHYLIVGVVVVVDPGIIPINSRGEKQRMHLRDGFLADQLDPIYVAYNM